MKQTVKTSRNTYSVILAETFLGLAEELKKIPKISRFVIITEKKIARLYEKDLLAELKKTGIATSSVYIPGGEKNKHINRLLPVYNQLIRLGADRNTVILSLGGGVVGDFSGFVASSYLRGVRFVQLPTTLLACVDSSVGGKVAINVDLGKNMVGAFYQPELVFAALYTLNTLPQKEWKCGYAEILKHALLSGQTFYNKFAASSIDAIDYKSSLLKYFIIESVRFKASIVGKDEKETGLRAILNLGHTTGHAIESLTNYTKYSHGEAVAMGLVVAMTLSGKLQGFPAATMDDVIMTMAKYRLPTGIPHKANDILRHMKHDKKNNDNKLNFVLLQNIGKPVYGIAVDPKSVKVALNKWIL